MAKPRKNASSSDTALIPQVGDKVKPARSEMIYEISSVSQEGDEVNLHVPGTNLERFRVRTASLTFVERKPPTRTSNPFTTPEPTFDAAEVLERMDIIRRESLKQIDDDIDILKSYLKTKSAPNSAIEVLEGLTIAQHKNWKSAVDRIKKLLEE